MRTRDRRSAAWWCAGGLTALLVSGSVRADLGAVAGCLVGLGLCVVLARLHWPSGAWATALGTGALAVGVGALTRPGLPGDQVWPVNADLGYAIFGYVVCTIGWLGPRPRRDIAIGAGLAVLLASSAALAPAPDVMPLAGLAFGGLVTALVGRSAAARDLTRVRRVRRWIADSASTGGSVRPGERGERVAAAEPAALAAALRARDVDAYLHRPRSGAGFELVVPTPDRLYLVWTRRWSARIAIRNGVCTVDGDPGALTARVRHLVEEAGGVAGRLRLGTESVVAVVAFCDDTSIEGGPLDLTVSAGRGPRPGSARVVLARGDELAGWLREEVRGAATGPRTAGTDASG